MRKVFKAGIALTAMLAFSAAVAQTTLQQPTVAQTQQAPTQATQASDANAAAGATGELGTVMVPGVGAVSTAAVIGAVILGGALLYVATEDDDDTPTPATSTR